jgi:LysM repeat protein
MALPLGLRSIDIRRWLRLCSALLAPLARKGCCALRSFKPMALVVVASLLLELLLGFPLAPSAYAGKAKEFTYTYVAVDGDTTTLVAALYGVDEGKLRRWNRRNLGKRSSIKAGTKLVIHSTLPIRVKRKATYIVKKGDSLKRISKKLGVDYRTIKRLSGLRRDTIRAGQELTYLVAGPAEDSKSVGRPSGGGLTAGEKMPEGPGYSFGSRPNVFGTNESITYLIQCIGQYKRKFPKGPDVVVGNLSSKRGGHLAPHKSHQSGRDVDLGYIHLKKFQPVDRMIPTDSKNIDAEKTWFLIKTFLDTEQVDKGFINYEVQEPLVKYLQAKRYKKSYIEKVFQYPRGKGAQAIFKHLKGHHHHLHLRFKCPVGDERCVE